MGRAYSVRKESIMKTAEKKTKLYSNYSKEIYNEAKKNPESNSLKRLLEKAKKDQVPSDIIKRALDKVKSGSNDNYDKYRYEGIGPSNSTIIIDCLTDNVNRSISYIRGVFSKTDFKFGTVSYMYDDLCVLSFKGLNEEQVLEILIENDINADVEIEENVLVIYGQPTDLFKIKTLLLEHKNDITFDIDELTTIAKETVKLNKEDLEKFLKAIDLLDEIEDVSNIYHNVEIEGEK